jgi:hypothetical protein
VRPAGRAISPRLPDRVMADVLQMTTVFAQKNAKKSTKREAFIKAETLFSFHLRSESVFASSCPL